MQDTQCIPPLSVFGCARMHVHHHTHKTKKKKKKYLSPRPVISTKSERVGKALSLASGTQSVIIPRTRTLFHPGACFPRCTHQHPLVPFMFYRKVLLQTFWGIRTFFSKKQQGWLPSPDTVVLGGTSHPPRELLNLSIPGWTSDSLTQNGPRRHSRTPVSFLNS